MSDLHEKPGKEKIFALDRRIVRMDPIDAGDTILDIGGGGEGIVGRLGGERVIALDRRLDELLEAPAGPMKLAADARRLPFADDSFDTVTSFFTLMFVMLEELPAVFAEAFRVLSPGGGLSIWDSVLPGRADAPQEIVAFRLKAILPHETVRTAYGCRWSDTSRHLPLYRAACINAGFSVHDEWEKDGVIYLRLVKPSQQ